MNIEKYFIYNPWQKETEFFPDEESMLIRWEEIRNDCNDDIDPDPHTFQAFPEKEPMEAFCGKVYNRFIACSQRNLNYYPYKIMRKYITEAVK